MNNVFSAVASDWHAGPQLVALVTGVFSGIVSALGCLLGGWSADRLGRWWAYFGSGIALAVVAILMSAAPWTTTTYAIGVLVYAFFVGACYASFSALVVHAIGRGVASTKYAICQSIGNIPVAYMTAFNGWVHDRFGKIWMLNGEALPALVCIAGGLSRCNKFASASCPVLTKRWFVLD
jgi:PAT family beta-lactamase induction signal transducer AmpG